MPDDPLVVFEEWLGEAVEARLVEPTAMVVATVSQECRPSTRTVLLKGLEEGRFVFFTNYESRKGQQIETNPCVSLSFLWYGLERQVHIEGRAVELSAAESDAYFDSRPLGSRIGAIVSPQSRVIGSRTGLMREFVHMRDRYGLSHGQKQEGDQKANNIPLADSPASQDLRDHPASIDISGLKRPDYWGGYAVTPERIDRIFPSSSSGTFPGGLASQILGGERTYHDCRGYGRLQGAFPPDCGTDCTPYRLLCACRRGRRAEYAVRIYQVRLARGCVSAFGYRSAGKTRRQGDRFPNPDRPAEIIRLYLSRYFNVP